MNLYEGNNTGATLSMSWYDMWYKHSVETLLKEQEGMFVTQSTLKAFDISIDILSFSKNYIYFQKLISVLRKSG
jgi:hypothetical protein